MLVAAARLTVPARLGEPHEQTSQEALVLGRIVQPGVGLTIWERELPNGLPDALARWSHGRPEPFEGTVDVAPIDVEPWLVGLAEPWRSWMLRDLSDLVSRLALAGGSSHVRLLFGPIHDDRCRRFHHDYLQLRMVCTYTGPGTEWAPEAYVNRAAMDHEWCCVDDANRGIVDPMRVRHANVGDVLMLKGAQHRTSAGRGAVHRSPPLNGAERVVLIASVI